MDLSKMIANIEHYDILGVGFGPANISLAIALEELMPDVRIKFLEKRSYSIWQPEMLISRSDIQNHPLRDLVTLRNPRSNYTFTNFLYKQGRLFDYLNTGLIFPFRKEYAQYIKWVADHFKHWVKYNQNVVSIDVYYKDSIRGGYSVTTESGNVYVAKSVVLAPGRTPYIPTPFEKVESDRIFHLTQYLNSVKKWQQEQSIQRIAVIGGSQSAVELMLDLSNKFPQAEIIGIVRNFGYRLKDTSPFMGEVFFPQFVDYYYHVDQKSKEYLNKDIRYTNYSAVDADVLNELYLKMYEQKIDCNQKIFVKNNMQIINVQVDTENIILSTFEKHLKVTKLEVFDFIVLATGFRNMGVREDEERYPPLLDSLKNYLKINSNGNLHVNHDYSIELTDDISSDSPLFINGLCESSHGIGDAGSFSLLSLRSEIIVNGLKRRMNMALNSLNNKSFIRPVRL
ncbi:SidA/IucD/PvdA family monooxygenase [Halotia wernerae UHCC 0503]|nr:SidA/IucD/PvdA family monooxygenase [Halotia wernerae UHCC 0503]